MKLIFKKPSFAIWNTVAGLTLLVVSFQNCSKAKFTIDPSAKTEALVASNILGGSHGDDGNIAAPASPGDDTGVGTTMPVPGNDTGIPKSMQPSTPSMPSAPSLGVSHPKTITFTRMCTLVAGAHSSKTLSEISGEMKLLITASDSKTVLCKVENIRQQILDKKPIDISSCTGLSIGNPLYVVEMSVVSDYAANNVLFDQSVYQGALSASMPTSLNLAQAGNAEYSKYCDSDDPLLIQLNTRTPKPVLLTAPEQGVMFDLLGQMIQPAHEKVLTSWFAESETENYFLALPNAQGEVLGIDQLFGNSTRGPDGRFASQGFAALAKYDEDHDHLMTPEDSVFEKLRLWKDANRDGIAQPEELFTLEEKGVLVIDLRFDPRYQEKDQHGNMVKYKSVVKMKDNSYGLVYDLWLKYLVR